MEATGERSALTGGGKTGEKLNETSKIGIQKGKETFENASKAFEGLLKRCGDYNFYQWRLTVISGYFGFFNAIQILSAVFLAATPEYFCDVPYLKDKNVKHIKLMMNTTVPWIQGKEGNLEPSKCQYYEHDFASMTNQSFIYENDSSYSGVEKRDCDSWIYSDEMYESTVVTEWDLVCDRKWLMSTTQSSFMLGILFGSLVFSALSDKIGRRPSTLICCCLFVASSIAVAFTKSFVLFVILRFIVAASGYSMGLITYVLLLETVSSKGRNIMGNLSGVFFILGFLSLSPLAYFLRDWRNLQLAISVPSVTILASFWILPESSRWLLMQGREEEGIKILKTIAKANNKKFPSDEEMEHFLKTIRDEVQKKEKNLRTVDKLKSVYTMIVILVRTPNMRKRNLISFYTWFVTSMAYYGLTFSGVNLNVSLYLSVTISALIEVPALATLIISLLLFGRRTIYCVSFFVGGLSCLSMMFIPAHMVGWNLALSSIGKFSISIAFGVAYIISAELVPTHVRNISLGMASVFARIGSGLAPYIVDLLGEVYYVIPFIIFGVLALLAGLLSLMLPETRNRCLPESVEEIEALPR